MVTRFRVRAVITTSIPLPMNFANTSISQAGLPCRPDIIQDAAVKSKPRFFRLFTYNLHLFLYISIDKVCSRCYAVAMRKGKG